MQTLPPRFDCCRAVVVAGATAKEVGPNYLIGIGVIVALVFVSQLTEDSSPKSLTAEHYAAIEAVHAKHAWTSPKEIELRSGIVVLDYEVPSSLAIPRKTFGQDRLLAIREALLPFGFNSYRVNVNGPPPGTGLVRRYGSARFLQYGEVEWLEP